jgi:hypothetical protein
MVHYISIHFIEKIQKVFAFKGTDVKQLTNSDHVSKITVAESYMIRQHETQAHRQKTTLK